MSKRLIQDLHAGISRRDWHAVETAANRLRDDVEKTVEILAGTSVGSLPNDYPLPKLASDAIILSPQPNVGVLKLAEQLADQVDHCLLGYAISRQNGLSIEEAMLNLRVACNEFRLAFAALATTEGQP